jgi:hypothetical protein
MLIQELRQTRPWESPSILWCIRVVRRFWGKHLKFMVPNICIMETASGKKTKSEAYGIGDHDFVPWQIGVVML